MAIEKTRIKFTESEKTGEVIGFVSRNSVTKQLRGVPEKSSYGKKVCVLSTDLKGKVLADKTYDVELKPMHNGHGYVVISAELSKFVAEVATIIVPKAVYQVTVSFGKKTVYFDPLGGKTRSSKTFTGAMKVLKLRTDVKDLEEVIEEFRIACLELIEKMEQDGIYMNSQLTLL